jgi:hypothetical protein
MINTVLERAKGFGLDLGFMGDLRPDRYRRE